MQRHVRRFAIVFALILVVTGPLAATHVEPGFLYGAVFVATNSFDQPNEFPRGNEIVMYRMAADGTLSLRGRFPTGGQGSGPGTGFRGDGLGSGHSVEMSGSQRWLLATNAGSDTLSVFHVNVEGLTLLDVVDSGGFFPNSVAIHGDLVYVLNAGNSGEPDDDGNITGFKLVQGHLRPMAGSTRGLNAGGVPGEVPDALSGAAQVSFTPDGRQLVVSIKGSANALDGGGTTGTGKILVFPLDANGLPSDKPVITMAGDRVPYSYTYDSLGNLLVAEAMGGANGTGAVSSYRISADGSLEPISVAIDNFQIDTCWLDVAGGGKYLYTANFGSSTISSYEIGADGSLRLLEAIAGTARDADSFNLDLRASRNGDFLYNVLPGVGRVAVWAVNPDGTLTAIGEFDALEPSPDTDPTDPFGPGGSPAGLAIAEF